MAILGISTVSLSTSGAAVTAPATLDWKASAVSCIAQYEGTTVAWLRSKTNGGTATPCLASKENIEGEINPGQTGFYASVGSGTATLYCEWHG